jgi:cytoplasmic iron level regulating protein YaaA (DUF328/UPF0246 family)
MHFVISPAKSLNFDAPATRLRTATQPEFAARAAELIKVLKPKSARAIAELMDLSAPLAELNAARYAAWSPEATSRNSLQAVWAFDGDVYGGLDARSLDAKGLAWAQSHVTILSGLYGALRPLDRLQPYRLEMGTALETKRGRNLYEFWGDTIAEHLNERLAEESSPTIVNLASQEYFRALHRDVLKAPVVECVFEDWKSGGYKVISFFAKRARGLMLRHAIERRARSPRALLDFDAEGYAFDKAASEPQRLVFRRRQAET